MQIIPGIILTAEGVDKPYQVLADQQYPSWPNEIFKKIYANGIDFTITNKLQLAIMSCDAEFVRAVLQNPEAYGINDLIESLTAETLLLILKLGDQEIYNLIFAEFEAYGATVKAIRDSRFEAVEAAVEHFDYESGVATTFLYMVCAKGERDGYALLKEVLAHNNHKLLQLSIVKNTIEMSKGIMELYCDYAPDLIEEALTVSSFAEDSYPRPQQSCKASKISSFSFSCRSEETHMAPAYGVLRLAVKHQLPVTLDYFMEKYRQAQGDKKLFASALEAHNYDILRLGFEANNREGFQVLIDVYNEVSLLAPALKAHDFLSKFQAENMVKFFAGYKGSVSGAETQPKQSASGFGVAKGYVKVKAAPVVYDPLLWLMVMHAHKQHEVVISGGSTDLVAEILLSIAKLEHVEREELLSRVGFVNHVADVIPEPIKHILPERGQNLLEMLIQGSSVSLEGVKWVMELYNHHNLILNLLTHNGYAALISAFSNETVIDTFAKAQADDVVEVEPRPSLSADELSELRRNITDLLLEYYESCSGDYCLVQSALMSKQIQYIKAQSKGMLVYEPFILLQMALDKQSSLSRTERILQLYQNKQCFNDEDVLIQFLPHMKRIITMLLNSNSEFAKALLAISLPADFGQIRGKEDISIINKLGPTLTEATQKLWLQHVKCVQDLYECVALEAESIPLSETAPAALEAAARIGNYADIYREYRKFSTVENLDYVALCAAIRSGNVFGLRHTITIIGGITSALLLPTAKNIEPLMLAAGSSFEVFDVVDKLYFTVHLEDSAVKLNASALMQAAFETCNVRSIDKVISIIDRCNQISAINASLAVLIKPVIDTALQQFDMRLFFYLVEHGMPVIVTAAKRALVEVANEFDPLAHLLANGSEMDLLLSRKLFNLIIETHKGAKLIQALCRQEKLMERLVQVKGPEFLGSVLPSFLVSDQLQAKVKAMCKPESHGYAAVLLLAIGTHDPLKVQHIKQILAAIVIERKLLGSNITLWDKALEDQTLRAMVDAESFSDQEIKELCSLPASKRVAKEPTTAASATGLFASLTSGFSEGASSSGEPSSVKFD